MTTTATASPADDPTANDFQLRELPLDRVIPIGDAVIDLSTGLTAIIRARTVGEITAAEDALNNRYGALQLAIRRAIDNATSGAQS